MAKNGKITTVRLQCDRCPVVRQGEIGERIEGLRNRLRDVGWLCRKTPDGVEIDVCPTCRAK